MSPGESSSTARAAIRAFSSAAAPALTSKCGSSTPLIDGHGPAVDAPQTPRRRQGVEVPAHGGLRDAERRAQLLETDGPARVDEGAEALPAGRREVKPGRRARRILHDLP